MLVTKKMQKLAITMDSNSKSNPRKGDQSMSNRHICPSCSYTLLRHIDVDGVYWYCSHCHEEIPIYI